MVISVRIMVRTELNGFCDLQVARLQETLQEEHQKYRNECDARKLLITDINELRYQKEDYTAAKQNSSDEEAVEDPVLLKLSLK